MSRSPEFFSWNVQSVKDLKLSCCFFSVKLFGFLKADAGMAGLARLNLNGFLKNLTFVSSQAPLIYLTPQFRFLQQVYYILTTLKFRYCEKAKKNFFLKILKGQIISKCPFGVIVWTKIPTKFFQDFCPSL